MSEVQNETMTVDEVGAYLRLHVMTIRSLIRRGELPARKVGREWRVDREELSRWIAERTGKQFTAAR